MDKTDGLTCRRRGIGRAADVTGPSAPIAAGHAGESQSAADLGDLLAVVESPTKFDVQDKQWQKQVFEAIANVGGFGPVVWLVENARHTHPPHITLLGIDHAHALTDRELLWFPEGGPAVGAVYARHPLRRRDYLPFARFHSLVLHEKSIEAARYLLSLGARDVEISWRQSDGKNGKADAGVETPTPVDISIGMGFGREKSGDLTIRVSGGAGHVFEGASDLIWPGRDPLFKLANDVARANAESFHYGINSGGSASVNAEMAISLERDLGLNLGGKYKRWEDLSFAIDATFDRKTAVPRG